MHDNGTHWIAVIITYIRFQGEKQATHKPTSRAIKSFHVRVWQVVMWCKLQALWLLSPFSLAKATRGAPWILFVDESTMYIVTYKTPIAPPSSFSIIARLFQKLYQDHPLFKPLLLVALPKIGPSVDSCKLLEISYPLRWRHINLSQFPASWSQTFWHLATTRNLRKDFF
jgi:hypothetical protein